MQELLTIIILTFNRPKILKELLRYHAEFRGNIIVADGSKKPEYINASCDRIRYIHLPSEGHDFYSVQERLKAAIYIVKTPYVLLHADRRFVTHSGINVCLDFLEKNRNVSAADGRYIYFTGPEGNYSAIPHYYVRNYFSTTAEDFKQRMKDSYEFGYRPNFYSVMRTEVWKDYVDYFPADVLKVHVCFTEFFLQMVVCMHGKIACLPVLFSGLLPAKKEFNTNVKAYKHPVIDDIMRNKWQIVIHALASVLALRSGLDERECISLAQKNFEEFSHHVTIQYSRQDTPPTLEEHLAPLGKEAVQELARLRESCKLLFPIPLEQKFRASVPYRAARKIYRLLLGKP